jgi:hypothetical protein
MEALLKAAQPIIPSNQTSVRPQMAPNIKGSSYFALDSHEVLSMFGPSLADAEASGFVANFLKASDSIDYEQVNRKVQASRPVIGLPAGVPSYFAHKDSDATHELLGLLGPAVTDSELSPYMAHFLA